MKKPSKAKAAPKSKPRPPKTKTPRTVMQWEWLVAHQGSEARALEILNCLEAVYIAKTIDIQVNLPPQPRLDRIFSLIFTLDEEIMPYPASKREAA